MGVKGPPYSRNDRRGGCFVWCIHLSSFIFVIVVREWVACRLIDGFVRYDIRVTTGSAFIQASSTEIDGLHRCHFNNTHSDKMVHFPRRPGCSKQRTYLAHSQKHVSRLDKRTNVTTWFNRRNDRKRLSLSIDMPNYLLPSSDKRASVSHIPAK